jgi:hypothetical protein
MDNFTIAVIIGAAAVVVIFGLMFAFDSKKPDVPVAPAPPAPVKPVGSTKTTRKRSA